MNILTLGAAGAGGSMGLMIFVVIMFVGMYFLSIRPQKKQQQKRQEMLKEMNKGDKVVTLGGIKGVIASIDRDNKEVVVDCDGIYLTFDINFIRKAVPADKVTTDAVKDNKPAAKAEETKDDAKEEATATTEDVKVEEPESTDDTKETTK
ncbi:preprotein translocase subunit YajC [Companilactobacillus crustorum]|uniref:Preprotein translocase subunit YajC n=1 Tax=Companilactobacillus crustorum TaxID=392416 RepID=A0AB34ACE3_9LACO|nr:preprotein translocase subunit YajC [Companilactobacillus crustorum]WDT66032.1 preprotein translocase subunit YajC [Companilactobacillus crustorum]GEO76508.1 preprotein translocase subunit YajC [Companilactobacillus crustorum]